MAAVTKADWSPDLSNPWLPQLTGRTGEAVLGGQVVYLKSDGLYWLADGGAADAEAKAVGFAAQDAASGEAITVLQSGWVAQYDSGGSLTPGAEYYLSATDGALDTAATTGGTTPIARAVTTKDIQILAR